MSDPVHLHLSRRESQIMDVIYQLGEASVAEVVERIPDQPGYNTVRNTMAILERKGHLRHRREGQRYLYAPRDPVENAKTSALRHLLHTFFDGSLPKAVVALLSASDQRLTDKELDEIAEYIERVRRGEK
ncbi:MAG TPA: BlaI/MecI/CopY family transcriptional regulator [Longimicrobiaceae bacterium]